MAGAPPLVNLKLEDFPGLAKAAGSDAEKLFRALNLLTTYTGATLGGGLTLTGNGKAFATTVDVRCPDWIAPTLLNSWVNVGGVYPNAGCYKDGAGVVRVQGVVKSGAQGTVVFTLPAGYRPLGDQIRLSLDGLNVLARIDVQANGNVVATICANPTSLALYFSFLSTDPAPARLSLSFRNTLGGQPSAVLLASAYDVTGAPSRVPVALCAPAWTTSGDQVVVSDVGGMQPGRTYRLTFLVLG